MTATQIIFGAYRDLGGNFAGQTMAPDILNENLGQLNDLIDGWKLERLFIYRDVVGTWTVLASFPDLTTSYTLAPGTALALKKNLAQRIAPAMKVYFKISEPLLKQIAEDAGLSKAAIEGVGPQ